MTQRGRRPGDAGERRQAILDAARAQFAEHGYDQASMRAVARRAEVDPALVVHYFGSKQRLFAEANSLALDPTELIAAIAALPFEARGRAITEVYVDLFEDGGPGVAMLRSVASDSAIGATLREFLQATILSHAADITPGPGAELRMSLAATQLVGAMFARHILAVPPLADLSRDELIDAIAPRVQAALTPLTVDTTTNH